MFAQGEVYIRRIKTADPTVTGDVACENGAYIISHSETGHHHVLDRADAEVMERTRDVPAGMRIIQAIVRNPTRLRQTAGVPHGEIELEPGVYEFRIAREHDPFREEARRVAD